MLKSWSAQLINNEVFFTGTIRNLQVEKPVLAYSHDRGSIGFVLHLGEYDLI